MSINFVLIMGYISKTWSYICSIKRSLPLAFMWMLFMAFFTYTILFVALIEKDVDFASIFYNQQSSYISLFVNFGLVIMLVFDYASSHKTISLSSFILPFIAILLCIVIKGHCDCNMDGTLIKYIWPISYEPLSIIIYVVFLFLIFILKVISLTPETSETKKEL